MKYTEKLSPMSRFFKSLDSNDRFEKYTTTFLKNRYENFLNNNTQ